jgi:Ras GTPase-activating-like protein IQGAP2/3
MSVAMLQAPSRASTSSSSSFVPVTRQNTMSSHDGARLSMRQSKRHSVTALYLSMSAKEKDLEIEDDLAKGMSLLVSNCVLVMPNLSR